MYFMILQAYLEINANTTLASHCCRSVIKFSQCSNLSPKSNLLKSRLGGEARFQETGYKYRSTYPKVYKTLV